VASVFKRKYRKADGTLAECSVHTVNFSDWSDPTRAVAVVRQVTGFESAEASAELGRNLEKLANLRAAGEPMPPDLRRYMERVPAKVRAKLAKWGLLNQTAEAAKKSIVDHISAYEQALRDGTASRKQKGRPATAGHVQLAGNRIRTLLKRAGVRLLGEISPTSIGRALRDLEAKGLRRKGIGPKSAAHYFGALYAFCSWAMREGLLAEHPLRDAAKPDGTTERRHERRAFEPEEIAWLLAVTENAAESFGMSGAARYWLYRLAAETGFRAGELRALVRGDLTLEGDDPEATVPAAFAKNRHERTVPLKPETAEKLLGFLAGKLPGARVFRLPRPEKVVLMLRADLKAAKAEWLEGAPTSAERERSAKTSFLEYRDEAGRYADFHSLRSSFATNLIASGVDVKTAQELLGHSTPQMTLGVYAKVLRGSRENAIRGLPDFAAARQAVAATGTDDAHCTKQSAPHCHENCTKSGARPGAAVRRQSRRSSPAASAALPTTCVKNGGSIGEYRGGRLSPDKTPPTGFEPVSRA
jgi:integrase